jgi:hypothetical protein
MVKPTQGESQISFPLIESAEKGNKLHESLCRMIVCALITFTLQDKDLQTWLIKSVIEDLKLANKDSSSSSGFMIFVLKALLQH